LTNKKKKSFSAKKQAGAELKHKKNEFAGQKFGKIWE